MGTDWIEKSTEQDGPSSAWLVKSERPSSVLTDKRLYAGQSSESWRTRSRRNLIPWKSREWPRNVSWECPTRVSPPNHGISRRAWFSSVPRTFRSGTEQDWLPPEPKHRATRKGQGTASGRDEDCQMWQPS